MPLCEALQLHEQQLPLVLPHCCCVAPQLLQALNLQW